MNRASSHERTLSGTTYCDWSVNIPAHAVIGSMTKRELPRGATVAARHLCVVVLGAPGCAIAFRGVCSDCSACANPWRPSIRPRGFVVTAMLTYTSERRDVRNRSVPGLHIHSETGTAHLPQATSPENNAGGRQHAKPWRESMFTNRSISGPHITPAPGTADHSEAAQPHYARRAHLRVSASPWT